MTPELWVLLAVAGLGLLGSLANTFVTLLVSRKVDVIKKATDGLTEKLVVATDKAAAAKGKAAGVEQERARSKKS